MLLNSITAIMRVIQTDVGLLERRRVINAVASHCHDGSLSLTALDYDQLLLRRRASKHDLGVVHQHVINLSRRHVAQVAAVYDTRLCLAVSTSYTMSPIQH